MKLYTISVLLIFIISCTPKPEPQAYLMGIWKVEIENSTKKDFDIWQFFANGKFCELKGKSDIDSTLICDESGKWSLNNEDLKIKIKLENGQKLNQTLRFIITQQDDCLLLEITKDKSEFGVNVPNKKLKLTKYKK